MEYQAGDLPAWYVKLSPGSQRELADEAALRFVCDGGVLTMHLQSGKKKHSRYFWIGLLRSDGPTLAWQAPVSARACSGASAQHGGAAPTRAARGLDSAGVRSTGHVYYVNTHTQQSTYDEPTEPAPGAPDETMPASAPAPQLIPQAALPTGGAQPENRLAALMGDGVAAIQMNEEAPLRRHSADVSGARSALAVELIQAMPTPIPSYEPTTAAAAAAAEIMDDGRDYGVGCKQLQQQ